LSITEDKNLSKQISEMAGILETNIRDRIRDEVRSASTKIIADALVTLMPDVQIHLEKQFGRPNDLCVRFIITDSREKK